MSHAIAIIEDGLVLKWCYYCGFYEPARERSPGKFTCSKCGNDTHGTDYYVEKQPKNGGKR